METKQCVITTNSKVNSTTDPTYYRYDSNQVPQVNYEHKAIKLESVDFIWSWYNIDDTNNLFRYTKNAVGGSINIPNGNYSATELASYLNSNITTITITIDSIRGAFHFSKPGPTTFSADFDWNAKTQNLAPLMGFDPEQQTMTSNDMYSTYLYNMLKTSFVYLTSQGSIQQHNAFLTRSSDPVIAAISLANHSFGDIIRYDNYDDFYISLNGGIQTLSFALLDENGNLLPRNNQHMSVTVKLIY